MIPTGIELPEDRKTPASLHVRLLPTCLAVTLWTVACQDSLSRILEWVAIPFQSTIFMLP